MEKVVERFEVKHLQILNENGVCDGKPPLTEKQIKGIYKWMVFARALDDKMLSLQRQGRIGTFAQIKGQEAANVASALALGEKDWIFPSFRENGALIAKGLPAENILLYYGGDERGNKMPKGVNCFTVAVPVSTQIPHAVGFAWGAKLAKENIVTAVYFGDGATSKGDFHEGLNFAGVFKLPIVFICQNNQWAISVPRSRQTASKTLAQKAIAYGFEGIQVDGNDAFAVYKAVRDAADKARKGGGPTLIECYTYRMGDHTTSDDATKYRAEKEVAGWRKKDPIDRLKKYMERKSIWKKSDQAKLEKEAVKYVETAVKKFESTPKQKPEEMFNHMYAELTHELVEQKEYLNGNSK